MSDDRLLSQLGKIAREEQEAERARLDERWDRLAAGQLSADEEAELRALAEGSAAARDAYHAFSPLGSDFHERVVAAIEGKSPSVVAPSPPPALGARPARRRRGLAWTASLGSLAATLVFVLLRFVGPGPLPIYQAELGGGISAERSGQGGAEPRRYRPGDPVVLLLRAATATDRKPALRVFFVCRGAIQPEPWQPEPVRLPGGNLEIRGSAGVDIPACTERLWVVLGRPSALPDAAVLGRAAASGKLESRSWRAIQTAGLVIEGSG
ncbi:MAG: hypothetical protein U0002_06505 [Thermoanaerobaculia bacterium]